MFGQQNKAETQLIGGQKSQEYTLKQKQLVERLEKKKISTYKQKKKYQADFGFQVEREPCALETLESFLIWFWF